MLRGGLASLIGGQISYLPSYSGLFIHTAVMTSMKGHESKSYETLLVIAGLLFKFTIVKMRGPNRS